MYSLVNNQYRYSAEIIFFDIHDNSLLAFTLAFGRATKFTLCSMSYDYVRMVLRASC